MFLPLLSIEGKYFVRIGKKKLRWKIFFQGGKLGSLISRKFLGRIHYCGSHWVFRRICMFILQILIIFMRSGCPDFPFIEFCFVSIKSSNMRFNIFIISLICFVNVF